MPDKSPDRRVQRTRRALHRALMELVLEKRYDKITVQEIIDHADVGRATFYAHFQDKDDLLVQGLAMFSDQLDAHLAESAHDGEEANHMLHSLTFFRHADLHHELYRAMREGGGWDIVQATARRHLTEDIERHLDAWFPDADPAEMPVSAITNFLTGAMLSVLMWWLDAGRPCSPEEVDEMFQQLAMDGVGQVLRGNSGGYAWFAPSKRA